MAFAHHCNQHIAPERNCGHRHNDIDFDILLCVRPDMRPYLVSLQAYNEKQVLYHLQDIQLGSPDDVFAPCDGQQHLFMVTGYILACYMAYMGDMCIYISRKVLGKQQYGTSLFGMQ